MFMTTPHRTSRASAGFAAAAGALGLSLCMYATPSAADPPTGGAASSPTGPVPVQLLSITDLHGYFGDYTTTVPGSHAGQPAQTVGGGAYLAAHLEQLRDQAALPEANSLLFSAGDDFSGWPDETEWFWNEPTIEYLNLIGLDFSTLGNHEFDRNLTYLEHMRDGSCAGRPDGDLCFTDSTGQQFPGADFPFYSANAVERPSGDLAAEPYHVEQVDDGNGGTLPLGFIHATTSQTANEGLSYWPEGELEFLPEVAEINHYSGQLQSQGVEAIVVVMHEGFSQAAGSGYNDCNQPFGPVADMNAQVSPAVDAIVSGHWHALVNCTLPDPAGNPRPVVEAGNHGRLINEIRLELDPSTGDVIRDQTVSINHANTRDVTPDPEVLAMAGFWRARLVDRRQEHVGEHTGDLTRSSADLEESTLANTVADSYLWAAEKDDGADLAVSMPGTLLRDLAYAPNPAMPGDGPGVATFAEVFFGLVMEDGIGFPLVTAEVTGREIDELLESQWQTLPDRTVSFQPLAVSHNVRYRYDSLAPLGERVAFGQVRVNGKPLKPNREYRIAALSNNLVQRYVRPPFTALLDARDPHRTDYSGADALAGYLTAHSPVVPPSLDRVRPVDE